MNELLPLINNLPALEALDKHLEGRIVELKKGFMHAQSMQEIVGIQATVFELERLRGLRQKYIAQGNNNG